MTILDRENRLIRAENAVIAFPHLFQPHAGAFADATPSYSVEVILDPANNPAHAQTAQDILTVTSDLVAAQNLPNANPSLMMPLHDGNIVNQQRAAKGKAPRDELTGKWMMRVADTRSAPVIYDQNRMPVGEAASANFFGGCICHVIFNLYWRKIPTNPGVSGGIKIVQLVDNVNVVRLGGGGSNIDEKQAQDYLLDVAGAPAPAGHDIAFGGPPALQQAPGNVGPAPTVGPAKQPWE